MLARMKRLVEHFFYEQLPVAARSTRDHMMAKGKAQYPEACCTGTALRSGASSALDKGQQRSDPLGKASHLFTEPAYPSAIEVDEPK